jgi:hypothetical protein
MDPEARRSFNFVRGGAGYPDSLRRSSRWYVQITLQVFILLVMCAAPQVLFSQQAASGQIGGQVTDQSGAVIPSTRIVAVNIATNVASSTQSNSSGYYSLQLPTGTYNISATKTGFSELVQNNIQVTVGSNVGLNLVLTVGATTTKVEVTATATPLMTPHEASVQTTVPSSLVSEIPVEVSGGMRNAADFLKLTPGYQGSAFSARLNGGVGLDQEVLVDGANVSPVGFGTGIQGNQMTVPSFAVKEFRVIGSNVDAQYGRTSTGAITYVFKSGTNQIHGSAFEYNRNEAYDARNFFAAKRNTVRQNEFGVEIGGPIKKDKIFYYGYYDGFRLTQSNNAAFYSLLTPEMKNGDFTAFGIPAIYDPSTTRPDGSGGFTRDQFSCNSVLNVICPNRISPISNYFYSLFPSPNLSGLSNNFKGTSTSSDNSDQFLVKVDTNISPTSRLSGSFSYMKRPTVSEGPFGPILSGSFGINHGDRAIINIWYFFNHQGGQQSLSEGSDLNSKAGLGGILNPTGQTKINAGGYFLGIGGNINKIAHTNAEIGDDLTWMHGGHQFQFGFNTTRFYTIGLQQAGGFTPFGSTTFAPQETALPGTSGTGFAVASFLVGNVDSGTFGQQPSQAWIMPYYAVYAQDQWKMQRNLTLSYGLRWDYNSPITDRHDRIANFDPSLQNPGAGNLPGALVFAGSGTGRSGKSQFADGWYSGFGPRIGITYAPSQNTVLRGSYSVMYDTNSGPAIFLNQQGFFTQATLQSLDGGVTPAFDWASGFPSVPLGPFFDPTFANGGSTSYMQLNGARLPIIQNFNVGVQHRFPGGVVVDASYVGTNAHHLLVGTLDYNQLNPQYLSLGTLLQSPANSSAAQTAGIQIPYAGFTGTVAQALRPYPQYQGITLSSNPVGNNTYNSLQIKAQKRYSHGLSFLVSYTLSKDLTDSDGEGGGVFLGGAQNYYNLRAEKAVAAADVPNAFVGSYSYDLPIGEGKLLNISNSIADKFFGEWTTSGIVTLQSGTPSGIGTELSLPAIGGVRPDVVSDQFFINNNRGSFDPAVDQFLNPAAFAPPSAFAFGNAPRRFSQIRTFGLREWDVAIRKKIPITEHVNFGIKMEFFNFLNTVNFGGPVTDINNPSFGRIFGAGPPRTGQLSGTISW